MPPSIPEQVRRLLAPHPAETTTAAVETTALARHLGAQAICEQTTAPRGAGRTNRMLLARADHSCSWLSGSRQWPRP